MRLTDSRADAFCRVHLDEALLQALNKVAPAANRKRVDFIRGAVREAIRRRELSNCARPVSDSRTPRPTPGGWSNAEEWKP